MPGSPLAERSIEDPIEWLALVQREIERSMGILFTISRNRRGGALDVRRRRQLEEAQSFFEGEVILCWEDWQVQLLPVLREAAAGGGGFRLAGLEEVAAGYATLLKRHERVGKFVHSWLDRGNLDREDSEVLFRELSELQEIHSRLLRIEEQELIPAVRSLLSEPELAALAEAMRLRRARAAGEDDRRQ